MKLKQKTCLAVLLPSSLCPFPDCYIYLCTSLQTGNIQPQSLQPAEPLWTDPGIKSGIGVCKLISTLKKKKKCSQGMNGQTFSPNPRKRGKSHHHHFARPWYFHKCMVDFSGHSFPNILGYVSDMCLSE